MLLDNLYISYYYARDYVLAGALTVLLWAGIVVYLNELQLEVEDEDRAGV